MKQSINKQMSDLFDLLVMRGNMLLARGLEPNEDEKYNEIRDKIKKIKKIQEIIEKKRAYA